MQTLWQDLRYGARMLVKTPGFTLIAVLTLSLGIGANTAIFSVVNALLLRPLPFADAERLVLLSEKTGTGERDSASHPNYADWRARAQSFEGMAIAWPQNFTLTSADEAARVSGSTVNWNFFPLLRVGPQLGRMFTEADDRYGAARTVIISHGFWQRRFGGELNAIGQTLRLTGETYTVIGVLPPGFEYFREADVYTPLGLTLAPDSPFANRGSSAFNFYAVARLKPGVTVAQANREMDAVGQQLAREYPEFNKGKSAQAERLQDVMSESVRSSLWILLGAVGFILLIACINVANLLLVRASERQKELAVRLALGAGRWRIIRQLLSESLLIAALGGAGGLLLGSWMLQGLLALAPAGIPQLSRVELNNGVLLFTLGLAVLTNLLVGLLPAWQASNTDLQTTLKDGGRLTTGASRDRTRKTLLVAEVSLSLVLLAGADETAQIDPKEYPHLLAESGSSGMLDVRRLYAPTIYAMFIDVALVLLIACANVANLLLARATSRSAEITVRLAVGAGRGRLLRQLLTESVLLAGLGGVVGVLFALWGNSALVALTDKDTGLIPSNVTLNVNWRVLAFTLLVSLLTGVLFGLAPAWRATKLDLATSLKQSRRTTGAVSRLSKGLIVAQVSLLLLLLVGAGLFIRTLYNLQRVNLGFNQESLLVFKLQPEQGGYKDGRLAQFYQQLFARLDTLPGVRAATFGRVPLIARDNSTNGILLPGEVAETAPRHSTARQTVRENYFATLEIPFLRGRGFTAQDDARAPQVAIVNQTFARAFFPNDDVLGKRITFRGDKRAVEIVGVVADAKYTNQRKNIPPLLYTPWQQEGAVIGKMYFSLRTVGEPTALAANVRQLVREFDSNLPVTEVSSQTARSQATLGQERLSARLLSFFGGVALLLAAIGLSGVLAYSVSQRTNEIGIRMALGAPTANVLRLVLWQGLKLVLLGLVIGAAIGYGLKRLLANQSFAPESWQARMANQLYGVSVTDPLTVAVIALLLIVVALLACWIPARRATKVDPMVALRSE